ncbi:MarR family winged helix-turn-helix transcriptional regulator [Dactylosporangium sp. AC04546]|uniref:MarR family winged helix-turn-helix transcriptional regulator n=1 Tax=Dactylosporangium sp. AC04546 TaxID=2862460 RepID=UPI001EDE55E2|nr:MarR family winged helix-turn-helix transcriptional regulator [Dactylosporangium sp. AC04546]WVK85744.1 MarR family winged helix-turn-helix transcriptional regulator [Dactylosporangium sp. AC04546]
MTLEAQAQKLEAQAQKLVAGLVRLAVMAPADGPEPQHGLPPAQRQVMLLLGRRDREFRLSDLAAELGSTVAATMAIVSPLIAEGLVEMRPAPSYAARDMRIAATERGLSTTPAPANWADSLLGHVEDLDDKTQARLLRLVTAKIGLLQQQGSIPVTKMCLSCRFFDGYRHPGTDNPHHCWFVDAPFGYRELRLHCPDHIAGNLPPQSG